MDSTRIFIFKFMVFSNLLYKNRINDYLYSIVKMNHPSAITQNYRGAKTTQE